MKRTLLSLATVAAMPATTAMADADSRWDGHMMWGGGYGLLGGLMMLVFWGAVIALIVAAVLWLRDNRNGGRSSDALETLRERLARGEIDEEEFRRLKAVLDE